MNNSSHTKLRLLFIPYLLLCAGILVLYTFFNWLLFIRQPVFLLEEEIRNLWIPAGLPWIPLIVWYRRRLGLLKYSKKAKTPVTGMTLLLGFAMIAPLAVSQSYLSTATGKLTRLNTVREIAQVPATRYYQIKEYTIDRAHTRTWLRRMTSGKYDQHLDLSLFMVCPLYDPGMVPASDNRHYPIAPDDRRLFILNGSLSDSVTVMSIPPERIADLSIVKGIAALSRFGLAGRNGAILVLTKDRNALKKGHTGSLPDSIRMEPQEGPVRIKAVEDTSLYPLAWVGVKYTRQISNRLDANVKRQRIADFSEESWLDYVRRPTRNFTYFDEIPYNEDYTEYRKAVKNSERFRPEGPLRLLVPVSEPFEARNGSKLPWIFGSFAIGAAIYFLILLFIPLDEAKVSAFLSADGGSIASGDPGDHGSVAPGVQAISPKDDADHVESGGLKDALSVFAPRKGFVVTPAIIYLNVAVFLAMVIAGLGFIHFTPRDLVAWGGNYGLDISDGQWWRLLTSVFLHGGFVHLLFNMYALVFVGIFLEPLLGRDRFALGYLVTGVLASFASYKIHPNTVGIGASGAIFGMYGIFLAFLLTGVFPPGMRKAFLASTLIFIVYNLIMGFAGNVDNAAHVGGLVSGFLMGLVLSRRVKREKRNYF